MFCVNTSVQTSEIISRLFVLWVTFSYMFSLVAAQSSIEVIEGNRQVFLDYNGFTILYAEPASPFMSSEGVILVPLKSFSALIGAEVTFSEQPVISASITRSNKCVKITKDNKFILEDLGTNEKTIQDFSVKVWNEYQGEIFVPIGIFRDGFSMTENFDLWIGKVSLSDSEAIENQNILSVPEMLPTILSIGLPTAILQPSSYKVEDGNKVELELRLWPGFNVPTEHVIVQLIGASKEGASNIVGPVIAPSKVESPCTRNQDTFTCKATFESEKNYDYIFVLYSVNP